MKKLLLDFFISKPNKNGSMSLRFHIFKNEIVNIHFIKRDSSSSDPIISLYVIDSLTKKNNKLQTIEWNFDHQPILTQTFLGMSDLFERKIKPFENDLMGTKIYRNQEKWRKIIINGASSYFNQEIELKQLIYNITELIEADIFDHNYTRPNYLIEMIESKFTPPIKQKFSILRLFDYLKA